MRNVLSKAIAASVISVLATAGSAFASSVDIAFTRVTPANSAQNPAAQFKCVADDLAGAGKINFTFTNAVGIVSSISEIYYDDGPLLGVASLTQVGTAFVAGGANPGNLPGANNVTPAFNATQQFSADAQGNPANGIDTAADSLKMTFDLINGNDFNSIVAALNSGALRIGLHVRSIGTQGSSDAFVNNPPKTVQVVPLPSGAWAGLAGLGMVAGLRVSRRR